MNEFNLLFLKNDSGKYKLSLEQFVVSKSKEMLRKMLGMSKAHRNQPKEAPNGQRWKNLNNKVNNNIYYNSNYKISVYESLLVQIND